LLRVQQRTSNIPYTLIEVRAYVCLVLLDTFTPSKGHAFRQDGRYFVLAERHKSKDTIGVYDTANSFSLARVSFSRIAIFPLPTVNDENIALSLANIFYELFSLISKREPYSYLGRSLGGPS
jgi:hypothetical protein